MVCKSVRFMVAVLLVVISAASSAQRPQQDERPIKSWTRSEVVESREVYVLELEHETRVYIMKYTCGGGKDCADRKSADGMDLLLEARIDEAGEVTAVGGTLLMKNVTADCTTNSCGGMCCVIASSGDQAEDPVDVCFVCICCTPLPGGGMACLAVTDTCNKKSSD